MVGVCGCVYVVVCMWLVYVVVCVWLCVCVCVWLCVCVVVCVCGCVCGMCGVCNEDVELAREPGPVIVGI
jgi:hypothetical protein